MACPSQPQHPAPKAAASQKRPWTRISQKNGEQRTPVQIMHCMTGTEGLPQVIPPGPQVGWERPQKATSAILCLQTAGTQSAQAVHGLPAKPGGEGRAGRPVTLLGREVPTQPTIAKWVSDSDDKSSSRHPGRQAQTWTVTVREREAMAEALCPDVSTSFQDRDHLPTGQIRANPVTCPLPDGLGGEPVGWLLPTDSRRQALLQARERA